MNKVEQETGEDGAEENSIDVSSMNSIHFNNNHCVLIANLKTSAGPNIMVPYKVDTGSDGNIMPLYIYKNYFLQ